MGLMEQTLNKPDPMMESLAQRVRQREYTKQQERAQRKTDRYLLNPAKLDKLAADTVRMMSPFATKQKAQRGQAYNTKTDAVEASIPENHPLKGYSYALREGYQKALDDPNLKHLTANQLLMEVPKFVAKEGKYAQEGVASLTDRIHEYKFKEDSSAGNLFGLFGGDDSIRALPGFEAYKEKKRKIADAAPDKTSFNKELGMAAAGNIAIGAFAKRTAIRAAISSGLRAATIQAVMPVPGTRVTAAITLGATALMIIPEAYLMAKASNAIERSDFGITASGWRKFAADMGVSMGIGGAGIKAAGKLGRKLVGVERAGQHAAITTAHKDTQKAFRVAYKKLKKANKAFADGSIDKQTYEIIGNEAIQAKTALEEFGKNALQNASEKIAAETAEATAKKVAATQEALKPLTVKTAAVEAAGMELMQNPTGIKVLQYMDMDKTRQAAATEYAGTLKAFTKEDAIEVIKPKLNKMPGTNMSAWEDYAKNATDKEMDSLLETMADPKAGMRMATARVNVKQLQKAKIHADAEIKWQKRAPKPDDPQGHHDGEKVFTSTKVREAREANEVANLTTKSQAPDGTVSDIPYSKFAKEANETDKALLDFGGKTSKASSGAGYKRPIPLGMKNVSTMPNRKSSYDPLATPTPEMQTARKAARAKHIAVSGYKESKPLPGLAGNAEMRIQQLRKGGYEVPEDVANAMRTGAGLPERDPFKEVLGTQVQDTPEARKMWKRMQPQEPINVKPVYPKDLSVAPKPVEAQPLPFKPIETVPVAKKNAPKITSKQAAEAAIDDAADETSAGTLKTLPSTNKTYSTVKTTNKFAKTAIDGKPEDIIKAWGGGKDLKKITKKNLQAIYQGILKDLPDEYRLPIRGTKADIIKKIEYEMGKLKGDLLNKGASKLEAPASVLPSTQGIKAPKVSNVTPYQAKLRKVEDALGIDTATEKTVKPFITTNKLIQTAKKGTLDDIIKAWDGNKDLKRALKKDLVAIFEGVSQHSKRSVSPASIRTKKGLIDAIGIEIKNLKKIGSKLEAPKQLQETESSLGTRLKSGIIRRKPKASIAPQKLFNPPDAEYAETVRNFAKAGMKYLDGNKTGKDALKAIRMTGTNKTAGKEALTYLHDTGKIKLVEGSPSTDAIEINGKYYEDVIISKRSIVDLQQRTNEEIADGAKAIGDEIAKQAIFSKGGVKVADDLLQKEAGDVLDALSTESLKGGLKRLGKVMGALAVTVPVSILATSEEAEASLGTLVGTAMDAGAVLAKGAMKVAKGVGTAASTAARDAPELMSGIQAHAIKVRAVKKAEKEAVKKSGKSVEDATKEYVKDGIRWAEKMNYVHRPVSEGAKKIDKPQMEVMDMAKINTLEHGGLPKVVNKTKKFWLNIHKAMSPAGLARMLYKEGTSPVHQVAQGMGAIALNTKNGKTVVNNILEGVIKKDGDRATIIIEEEMADLATAHTKHIRPLEVVEQKMKHKLKAEKDVEKEILNSAKPSKELQEAAAQYNREIGELEKMRDKLLPGAEEWKAAYSAKTQDLAKRFSRTRISLAAEDTDDFLHNPWLKGMLNDEELEAVAHLKNLNKDYGERVKMAGTWVNKKGEVEGGGTELIKERPYMHHAWHPSWNKKDLEDSLSAAGFDTSAGIKPFSKFFRRSRHSQQLMPDASYNMNKYVGDTEKRIVWDKFWQNGNPNGWAKHANNSHLRKSEVFATFWDNMKKAAAPEQFSKTNVWANRYSGMEVFRLLSVSPSVAFKHVFKNVGTWGTVGMLNAVKHMPEAMRGAARIHIAPTLERSLAKRGIKYKVTGKDSDELFYSWTHQGNFHGTVSDLGFERIADMNKLGRAFDKGLAKVNHYTAFPVRAIESFDRFHAMQVSLEMAAKRGMTKQQAMYGVYDTILKNSFLGGPLNPPWMKDAKFRALFLFQNTAFKIAEKRANLLMKTGKSIGRGIKVLKHWDNEEALAKMKGIEKFVEDGQTRFKAGMLLDALKSEKDVFGTPVAAQALREAVIAGGLIGVTGGLLGTDVKHHIHHLPFIGSDQGGNVTIRTNPALNALLDAANDPDDVPSFFVTRFLRSYAGQSKGFPLIMNKTLRISDNDAPKRYLNPDGDKNTAALIRYFFGAPAQGRH